MRKFMILAALVLAALSLTGFLRAQAGAFEDGANAYRHGDYRTSQKARSAKLYL